MLGWHTNSFIGCVLVKGGSIFVSLVLFWCLVVTVVYIQCTLVFLVSLIGKTNRVRLIFGVPLWCFINIFCVFINDVRAA